MNLPAHSSSVIIPDGATLTVDRLAAAARDRATCVALTPAIRERVPRPAAFDVRFERRIVVHPLTATPARGA